VRAKLGQKASEGGKVLVDPSAMEALFDALEQSNPGYFTAHAQTWRVRRSHIASRNGEVAFVDDASSTVVRTAAPSVIPGPACRLPWRGHDNTACERARITRAVVEWRAAHARHRGQLVREGSFSPTLADRVRDVAAAWARFRDATVGIPEAERLARAIRREALAQAFGLDTARGRADYGLGYRQAHPTHPVHAAVREALTALLDTHAPDSSQEGDPR
jgi:hypothetical protein